MRIPFPERIPLQYVVTFATVLAVVELLEGTDLVFTLCVFGFIILSGVAFNIAGGVTRPSGGYIFFYAILTAILAWVVKAILGEAADSNLMVPNLTAMVYLGTMFSMTISVIISKKLTAKKPWLGSVLTDENLEASAVGCAVMGLCCSLALATIPHGPGSLLAGLNQVNQWSPLAVVIGVIYEMKRSGGRRSVNGIVLLGGVSVFIFTGLLPFTKLGVFLPLFCYLAAAICMGYQFSLKQIFGLGVVICLMTYYLVPYAQYGRALRPPDAEQISSETFLTNVRDSWSVLSDPEGTREAYQMTIASQRSKGATGYFNEDEGIFDREQTISIDDKLIKISAEGVNPYGLLPFANEFGNLVPHFLWPDKLDVKFGNLYAHEVGMLANNDFTTGISWSAGCEAFHVAGWPGVFLLEPAVFVFVFWFLDSLCGDTRTSPWGLLSLAVLQTVAPEGMLSGALGAAFHLGAGLTIAALFCAYIMPIVGSLVIGPQKNKRLQAALERSRQRSLEGSRP